MLLILTLFSVLLAISATAKQQPLKSSSNSRKRYNDLLQLPGDRFGDNSRFMLNEDGHNKNPLPWINDQAYWGIKTFSRSAVPPVRCLTADNTTKFDVAIVGAPFDTATSYRPGARFGPNGIRQGSQLIGGYNRILSVDPFEHFKVVDCGDFLLTPFDNLAALDQLEQSYYDLISRKPATEGRGGKGKDGKEYSRLVTLGGDHTIVLPILRALEPIYGPITVIHFDSHLDTWPGDNPITHGNYFYVAWKENLMTDKNIHVGIKNGQWNRTHHNDEGDDMMGFSRIYGEDIDEVGYKGVIKQIRDRVGDNPVYITLDIDVVDPSFAPATGTPATGGYTPREIQRIVQGLAGLKIIGADVVEVAPAYDNQAETTSILAASIAYEFLSMMALTPF